MIYKIVVDKQPKENPSEEKRIYEIDIEELRMKGDVYDSLVITYNEDYIMRRLSLNEYMALNVLDTPIKEPLENINIELFQGDNYIYIIDVTGEKLYAEYLVENKFNELYVTKSEMTSAINQSANAIELRVDGKITRVDGEIEEINAGLELKVDKDDNDQVISMINASADEINLTSNRISIDSSNFKLTKYGYLTCQNADIQGSITSNDVYITGGNIDMQGDSSNPTIRIHTGNNELEMYAENFNMYYDYSPYGTIGQFLQKGGYYVVNYNNGQSTSVNYNGITTPSLTQTSKEESKKNFEKLTDKEAIEILKNTDIYKYNMKVDDNNKKKHIGFVIGKNYNYSKSITTEDENGEEIGVDTYSMISAAYKVIQIQQEKIEELEQRIEKLEKGEN